MPKKKYRRHSPEFKRHALKRASEEVMGLALVGKHWSSLTGVPSISAGHTTLVASDPAIRLAVETIALRHGPECIFQLRLKGR